ncbi:MAG: hypothetical protein HDS88_04700 [Bacteroidales bacterium]|nr:hypothetical protein [Bacteroidales bacterium]
MLYNLSKSTITRNFWITHLTLLVLLICTGCSDDTRRGEWVKSKEGVKVYVPCDFSDKYDESTLSCTFGMAIEETDTYLPPFKISVNTTGTHPKTIISENELIPSLIPVKSLKYKLEDGKYAIVAGDVIDGSTTGYAWNIEFSKDSIPYRIECGDFKDNRLTNGFQMYTDFDDNSTVYRIGSFKDGKLHMGIKLWQFPDSIGEKIIGVWNSDGSLDQTYENLARQYTLLMTEKGYDQNQMEVGTIEFAHRYFFWVKYKWWFFIGFSLIGILFVLATLGSARPDDKVEAEQWDIDNYRIKPWTCTGAFLRWLVFSLLRIDLYYLRDYVSCSLLNLAFWTVIVGSSKFIVLYALEPDMWIGLLPDITNHWQGWVLIACLAYWLVGLIMIPYKVYRLNFNEFRHNIYEELILGNRRKDYESLYAEIPRAVKTDGKEIQSIVSNAQREYDNELGFLSKVTSFFTNSKVRHAREKAQALLKMLQQISRIALKHSKLLHRLTGYLEIERKNAYRNMILAKELLSFIRSFKDRKKDLMHDNIGRISIQSPDNMVSLDYSSLPDVDLQESLINGFESFDSTFTLLKDCGFEDKDSLVASLGIGAVETAIDGISQINSRRAYEREHYEYLAADYIHDIQHTAGKLVEIHGKMLRANEIMHALTAANEAFVKAYTPLRDQIFGTSCTFDGFIAYIRNRHKIRAIQIKNDVGYLMTVCSEYNKINMSKL